MPQLTQLDLDNVRADAKEILTQIQHTLGMVPNLFLTYANHPPLLDANWYKMKRVMMEGTLPQMLKEAIALVVSEDNGCDYCLAHHGSALKGLGLSDDDLRTLKIDTHISALNTRDGALLRLARQANRAPHEECRALFDAAREAGASDAQITEALAVMEIFAAFNRFIDFTGVPLEG